jgi:hypothetical protein
MPRLDGKGPMGRGSGSGHGMGRGRGPNASRDGNPMTAQPAGYCVCPRCQETIPHIAGQPCNQIKCPKCGTLMIRE